MERETVVLRDKHNGTFGGGLFIAIAEPHADDRGQTRLMRILTRGPFEGDGGAMEFWMNPPDWIATGDTPDDAIQNLKNGVRPVTWDKLK